jgi:type II secretory ATPase GspE/PulE/Tfp pilus assembly ATPase PilB-like protein
MPQIGATDVRSRGLEDQRGPGQAGRGASRPSGRGASDIHIEPYEKELRIRYRVDGVLYNIMAPPMKFRDPIASRVKIMAKLDIAEKRLPQDGRIKIRYNDNGHSKEIDFRVSSLPTLFGEKIVLRLLDRDKLMLDMTRLGFEADALAKYEEAIQKPWGMVLVTGPTGSGKTNPLYSSISRINKAETNILTAEDHRVQPGRDQPRCRSRKDRAELRRRAAQLPAAGSEHHPRR